MFTKLPIPELGDPKALLRYRAKVIRKELHEKRTDAGQHAARIFLDHIPLPEDAIIASYYSVGSELDSWPLTEELLNRGYKICLPFVEHKNAPLLFRQYTTETELTLGAYKIMTPPETMPVLTPDIILCPLLAFDETGTRLGMGGGFYDRTLEALRAKHNVTAVGFAYAGQETDNLPHDHHDQRLDYVISERGVLRCGDKS